MTVALILVARRIRATVIDRRYKYVKLSLLLLLTSCLLAHANELRFQSSERQAALIELYTSEGCSSCPPAEAWLSKLKFDPKLWKDFVPLAFHVDYWDRLGWRDRFAEAAWTQRQYAYVSVLHSEAVYTPEFIVNGNEWRDWMRNRSLPSNNAGPGILSATTLNGEKFAISFKGGNKSELEAHVALLGCGINSKIGAGENNGRQLQHDFVVLAHGARSMMRDGQNARADIEIEKSNQNLTQKAVAIWITPAKQLAPLQATGGWLGNVALKK